MAAFQSHGLVERRARPAEALLASLVLREEELEEVMEGFWRKGGGEEGRLGTGVGSLDRALEGGLDGGRVVGVGAEAGGCGSEVSDGCL